MLRSTEVTKKRSLKGVTISQVHRPSAGRYAPKQLMTYLTNLDLESIHDPLGGPMNPNYFIEAIKQQQP